MKHPYVEYESSKLWMIVRSSVEELVENNDIELLTPIEYVVGYICKNVSSPVSTGVSSAGIEHKDSQLDGEILLDSIGNKRKQ